MKYIYKNFYLILLTSLFLLSSCEDERPNFYQNPDGFIQLAATSGDVAEDSTDGYTATVLLGAGTNESGVTVNYTLTSDDNSRFTDMGAGTVTIPAGEFSADIVIMPIDNVNTDGNLEIILELSDNNTLDVGIGGEGVNNNKQTITILDNDCPIDVSDAYETKVFAFGDEAPSHSATFTPVAGTTNTFLVSSLWGPNFVGWATGDDSFNGSFVYEAEVTINPDLTVTVANGTDARLSSGTGTYSTCDDKFVITLSQTLFSGTFTVGIEMTGL